MSRVTFSITDWLAVALFLSTVIGLAMWVRFRQKGSEDYFLAGRSMGWLIVFFSLFATVFSTISFVSVPGEAYQHGLMFSLMLVGSIIFFPVGIWLFLRFFFLTRTFTAYEYLECRYSLPVRLLGAGFYCIVRLFYAGTVFYAAARVFESLVGWPPLVTIVGVGLFTIAYASTGGMKAVMLTDTIQGIVVIIGIAAIFTRLLQVSGGSIGDIYSYAVANDHGFGALLSEKFYRFDLYERFNVWIFIINISTIPLISMSADQSVVQRLLAAKGYHGAKRAVLTNAVMSVPIVGMLWIVGIGLFYFYGAGPGQLPAEVKSDHVLGFFINTQLPSPLPGLIAAALLAALMSTIDSTVNCIANVIHRDGLLRLKVVQPGSKREMLLCRGLSVAAGFAGVSIAVLLLFGSEGIKSNIFEVNAIWSGIWAVLLMAFLWGVLVPRVSSKCILVGMIVGGILNLTLPYLLYYRVPAEDRISFAWISVPGMTAAALLPLLLSLFWPNKKNLQNLTLWTLTADSRQQFTKANKAEQESQSQEAMQDG